MDVEKYIKNNKLKIIVKPNSKKTEILDYNPEKKALRVNIKSPAHGNKANIEIIKLFSKILNKNIKISFGLKNKEKTLEIV
ncbi:MAG: DUF167 domain-containing protein [Candidatus Woesearchaeota archaeon]